MLSTSWKKKWESSKCEITWNFISHAIHEVLPSNVAQYCVSPLKCCSAHFYFPWNFYPISLASAKWQLIYYQPLKNQNELETWMEQERRILERKRRNILCFWLEREFWNHPSIFLLSCCYSCFNLATTTDTYKERNRMTLRQERMGKREQTC